MGTSRPVTHLPGGLGKAHIGNSYTVVTTVRSEAKGDQILKDHAEAVEAKKLSYQIVSDIAADGAFDKVSLPISVLLGLCGRAADGLTTDALCRP